MPNSGMANAPRRLPSYTELARARREAEELEEVRLAYGGTLPTKEEMERSGHPFRREKLYGVMIRYVAPVMMAALFLQSTGLLKRFLS